MDSYGHITGQFNDRKRSIKNHSAVVIEKKPKVDLGSIVVYAHDLDPSLTIQKTRDLNPSYRMDFYEDFILGERNDAGHYMKKILFKVEDIIIGEGQAYGKKEAKANCIQNTAKELQKLCKVVPFFTRGKAMNMKSAFAKTKSVSARPINEIPAELPQRKPSPISLEQQIPIPTDGEKVLESLDLDDLAGLRFAYVEDMPFSYAIQRFAKENGMSYEVKDFEMVSSGRIKDQPGWGAKVILNGTQISSSFSIGKKAARNACLSSAMKVLRERCDYVETTGRKNGASVVTNDTSNPATKQIPAEPNTPVSTTPVTPHHNKPLPLKPVIFYHGETHGSSQAPVTDEVRKPEYYSENTLSGDTDIQIGRVQTARHLIASQDHVEVIHQIREQVHRTRPGRPYCAADAARWCGEEISQGIYQCGKNLLLIKDYLADTQSRLYNFTEDLSLTYYSKYCVLSIRGIEIAYGFGFNAKKKAFDMLEQILRAPEIYVISALRHNGGRVQPQLTIAVRPGNRGLGYILPMHFVTILAIDASKIEDVFRLEDLTLFMLDSLTNPHSIIARTAEFNNVKPVWKETCTKNNSMGGADWKMELFFVDVHVADGKGVTKKDAKQDCASNALKVMMEKCRVFSERAKQYDENALELEQVQCGQLSKELPYIARRQAHAEKKAAKMDKGAMMMKLMGWSGGGLGKLEDGDTNVVGHNSARIGGDKQGLGVDEDGRCKVSAQQAETLIARYASSKFTDDLAFSKRLGKEERKTIHRASQRYGLKSKSYGTGADRYLVVMRTAQQKLSMLQSGCKLQQASLI